MSTDLDDRIRRLDPAHDRAEAVFDPDGPTADAIHTRALTNDAAERSTTSQRRWPAIAASVVVAAGIGAGAVAVADRRRSRPWH